MNFAFGSGRAAVLASIDVAAGDIIELRVVQGVTSTFGEFAGVNFSIQFEPDVVPPVPGLGPMGRVLLVALLATSAGLSRRRH